MCLYLIAFHQSQKTTRLRFFFFLNLERLALLFSPCLWLLVSSAKMGHQRRPYTQRKTTTIHVIFTWTRKQWFVGRKGWLSCGQNSAIHMILNAHSLGLQQRSAKVIEVTTDPINRTSAAALSETPRCLHRRKLHNTPTCVDTRWDLLPLQLCSP